MYRPDCSQLMIITLLALQLVCHTCLTQEYSVEERIHIGELYVDGDSEHGGVYTRVDRFTSAKLPSANKAALEAAATVVDGSNILHQQTVSSNHMQQLRQQHHDGNYQDPHHHSQQQQQQANHHFQQQAQQANFINHQGQEHHPSNQQPHQASQHHQQVVPHQSPHRNFQTPQLESYDSELQHPHHHSNPHHHHRHHNHHRQQQQQQQHQQLEQELLQSHQQQQHLQHRSHQQQLQFLYQRHQQQLQSHIHEHTQIEWRSEASFHGVELREFYMHNFETSYHIAGVPTQDHASSCNSVDDPTVLIMPVDINEPTCEANSDHVPKFEQHNNKPSRNSNVESFPLTPQHYHYESSLMTAIRHYWREISGLCLASAIFLNWLFVVVKRRFIASGFTRHIADVAAGESLLAVERQTNQTVASAHKAHSKDTLNSSAHDSAFEENISPLSLDDVDITTSDESSLSSRPRSISSSPYSPNTSSQPNSSLLSTCTYTSDYISRYSSDFDSIQRLGRGGFGIVFEAKNKIDDCHYAVKRICLPLEKEARERVMREVRALAKLDHAGIVRYYNAWLETPPDEWLKQHDAQLGIVHTRDGLSFPSTDGIYDKNELNPNTNGDICDKFGESGDMSISEFLDNKSHFNSNKRRSNGYKNSKYLRETSSSPSLDIVFEGSGSIRLEAENGTEKSGLENGREAEEEEQELKVVGTGLHLEKVYLYIQMQLCRKDTLKDWLRTNCENRDKTTIFDFFYQIVDAVEYVHSQDLIHRDLKPSNIFFSLDGTLKIGDFGLCRAKTNACVGSSLDLKEYSADFSEAVHTEQVGTQLYMSPEQMNGLSYNHKVDIFAMGLILLELLVPFKTQMQRVNVLLKARNNMFSREFKKEHPDEHDLVRLLLDRRPCKRPAATAIKQHELLANAQLSQPVIERIYHRRRTISSNSSTE